MKNSKGIARSNASVRRPRPKRSFSGAPDDWPTSNRRPLHSLQLTQTGSRYAELYDFAPVGFVSFDQSGRIAEANLTAAQLFEYPRERIIGMPFTLFVLREDTDLFLHHLLNCRRQHARVETELRLKNARREIIWAHLSSAPILAGLHDGALLYQTAIVDITERRRAEQTAAEAVRQQLSISDFIKRLHDTKTLEQIYDAALDAICEALRCDGASIFLFDKKGVLRFVAQRGLSRRYCYAVEGHSPWKRDTKNPEPICVSDVDVADIPRQLRRTIRREGIRGRAFVPLISEQRLIGKLMIYFDAPHLFTEAEIGIVLNIARQLALAIERKRADEALRESEERLRAIFEQTAVGIHRCDFNGRFLFANQKLCQMLGYAQSELIGKTVADVTHPADVEENMRLYRRLGQKGQSFEFEKRYIRKDGSMFWGIVTATAIRDAAGKPRSAATVAVDITERKKAEAAVEKARAMLEELVEQRTKALRSANKELENEIKRRKGLEREILTISDREQERLARELHDGLCQELTAIGFMARVNAMRLRDHRVADPDELDKITHLINRAVTDARSIAHDLHKEEIDASHFTQALRDLAERQGWQTPCRLELKTELHIESDQTAAQLYRILREALVNANKHASATKIVVGARRARDELVLSVEDNGVGLPEKIKSRDGLGFHSMRHRAELIGARLEVRNGKKSGTRVAIYLKNGETHTTNVSPS